MSKSTQNVSSPNTENKREFGEWMFESSPDCVKFLDMDGNLLAMNGNGMCAMEIDDFSDFCGRHWHSFWPESSEADIYIALNAARNGQTGRFNAFCPTAKGMPKWWDVIITPVRAYDGQIQNLLAVSRDVTALRKAEADRANLAAQLQLALDAAELGAWHFTPADKTFKTDHRFRSIFGLNLQEVSYDSVLFTIHPGDRKWVRESIKAAACPNQRTPFNIEFRTVHPGGAIHWIAAKGQASVKNHNVNELFVQLNGTVANITERKQVEEERQNAEAALRHVAAELSETDRRKSEFLAMLAHELRNPLAPIRNGLHVLRLAAGNPERIDKVREMMERQVTQLVRLVDDLLDVARISSGKIELKKESSELKNIVLSAVETSLPIIEANHHHMAVFIEDETLILEIDPTRIAQVLSNLLNNAAKYTPPGGRIKLLVRCENDQAILSVSDNGIGIKKDAFATIFNLFSQVPSATDRAQGGLGIGLSLVRRLVEMHGGTVSVASPGLNKGSTFTVSLPLINIGDIGTAN